ncbi:MAG TPA: nucleotidyltransferase domain-containing protein [bacterium]|nr:nucleotidyltransferase domain-containing protein [bacterium]
MKNFIVSEKKMQEKVRKFSIMLGEKYGVKKVYLFGSLAEGLFLKGSDIDLAVEGMDLESYLKALAEYRVVDGVHLDILHLSLCKPGIKKQILKNSNVKILYEKE